MKSNVFTYLTKYGNKSFDKLKFNEVDAGILSQIAYIRFEKVNYEYPLKLKVVTNDFLKFEKEIRKKYVLYDVDIKFIKLLNKSTRFNNIEIMDSYSYFNILTEAQVCAYTAKIKDDEFILSFRGTDETILGWKEALKLGFEEKSVGHIKAKKYFEKVLKDYPNAKFNLMGHSKGGNFAIYAASSVDKKYDKRIKNVYNFDGPSLLSGVKEKTYYNDRSKRIITFLPKASVVGAVLEHDDIVKVVDSDLFGLFQHVIFNWKVDDKCFKTAKRRTIFSSIFERSFRRWLFEIPYSVSKRVIATIFAWADKANIKNIDDFASIKNSGAFLGSFIESFGKHKKEYKKYIKKFIDIYISESKKGTKNNDELK